MSRGPRVVALGGGHGLAATLRAVRQYGGDVTAIDAATGKIKDQFKAALRQGAEQKIAKLKAKSF